MVQKRVNRDPVHTAGQAHAERLHRTFQWLVPARLDANWFNSLEEVRHYAENWRQYYNLKRPHETLNNLSPAAFAARLFSQTQAKA